MTVTLGKRQQDYEDCYDNFILKNLPIIIRIKTRSYRKLNSDISSPFNFALSTVMANTALYVATHVQDAIFVFQCADEINIVLKKDNNSYEPWYQNNIQKIGSVTASLATLGFFRAKDDLEDSLSLPGEAIFDAKVFGLPVLGEVFNNLIYRQQKCIRSCVFDVCFFELSERFNKQEANKLLSNTTSDQKVDILFDYCGIDFFDCYPINFIRGVAVYKVPTVVPTKNGDVRKNKWKLNWDIPDFLDDKDFLYNILLNGADVYRAQNILT